MDLNHTTQQASSTRDAWVLLFVAITLYIVTAVPLHALSLMGGVIVGQVLFFLLPSVLYAQWKTSAVCAALRLRPLPAPTMLRVALLALTGIGLEDLIDQAARPVIAHYFGNWIPAMEAIMEMLTPKSPQGLAGNLFVVGMLAPFCEEVLFRGAFQGTLEQRGPVRAITFSAVLFGLLHVNPFNFIGPILFGLALGFSAWRTGSILPAILWHAINNSAATVLFYSGGSAFTMPLWLDGVLAAAFGLLLWEFIRHTRGTEPQLSPLATAPAVFRGGALRLIIVAGCACVLLLLAGATCFRHARLTTDLLAPDYRAGDLIIFTHDHLFRSDVRAQDVVVYRTGKSGLRCTRVLRVDGSKLIVVTLNAKDGSKPEVVIERKDIVGKVVWKFDPGEDVKQLMRQIEAKRSASAAKNKPSAPDVPNKP